MIAAPNANERKPCDAPRTLFIVGCPRHEELIHFGPPKGEIAR